MPRKNSYKPSEHVSKVILAATRASPGIRSDALAKETALHETTVSTAGRVLIGKGLLRREKKGRHFHYYPAGAEDAREPQQLFLSSEPLLEAEIDTLKAEIDTLKAEIDTLEDEIDTLEVEVEDLRAFKARALAAYPDLGTDPLILRARNIVAELLPQYRDVILSGDADEGATMRGAVATLRAIAAQKED